MPVDILKHLGSCLKKARKERHLTQELLSEKTGISVRHIAKIEKGVMNPSFEVLYALLIHWKSPQIIYFAQRFRMTRKKYNR